MRKTIFLLACIIFVVPFIWLLIDAMVNGYDDSIIGKLLK
jgi:hypothetical protein